MTNGSGLPVLIRRAAVLALLVLFGACGGNAKDAKVAQSGPSMFVITGHLTVTSSSGLGGSKERGCYGENGFSDIQPGAQVVIRDSGGDQIALGELGQGSTELSGFGAVVKCAFTFSVPGVPVKGEIYSVEVTHRGPVSFRRSDANHLELTLGD